MAVVDRVPEPELETVCHRLVGFLKCNHFLEPFIPPLAFTTACYLSLQLLQASLCAKSMLLGTHLHRHDELKIPWIISYR